MNKNPISYILFLISLFFVLLLKVNLISAQETSDDEVAKKYQISFPITALGNCSSISDCKDYCSDPQNKEACNAYARLRGFHREQRRDEKREALVLAAKEALGCTTGEECKALCALPENFEKCRAFAKQQGFDKPQQENKEQQKGEKAKEILGCDNTQTCREFCEQEANRQKCVEFANAAGIHRDRPKVGPGGCDSEEACRAYCEDEAHAQECNRAKNRIQNQDLRQGQPNIDLKRLDQVRPASGSSGINRPAQFGQDAKSPVRGVAPAPFGQERRLPGVMPVSTTPPTDIQAIPPKEEATTTTTNPAEASPQVQGATTTSNFFDVVKEFFSGLWL